MAGVAKLPARYPILLFCFFSIFPFLIFDLLFPEWYFGYEFFADSLMGVFAYVGPMAVLIYTANRRALIKGFLPGRIPPPGLVLFYLSLSIPMVGVSFIGIALFYLALSVVVPGFVDSLFTEPSLPTFVLDSNVADSLGSFFNVMTLVILAPVVEELIFRWLLIERWSRKYSTWIAVVLSSMIFAIFHFDPLGSFIFGIILSLIYLRTGSLWGPILIHIGNNVIVFSSEVYDLVWPSSQEIRSDISDLWIILFVGLILIIPWLPLAKRKWSLAVKLLSTGVDDIVTS